jgi:hypothetical protein
MCRDNHTCFSPNTLPEILKLAKEIKANAARIYERSGRPFFMVDENGVVDLEHVWHTAYQDNDLTPSYS